MLSNRDSANVWTANGYYHLVNNGIGEPHRILVNPETGEALGSPELLPDVNGEKWFAWSPDMERIA